MMNLYTILGARVTLSELIYHYNLAKIRQVVIGTVSTCPGVADGYMGLESSAWKPYTAIPRNYGAIRETAQGCTVRYSDAVIALSGALNARYRVASAHNHSPYTVR